MATPLIEQLTDWITPVISELGFSLWGIEYRSGGKRKLLRVYIDGANPETGVNIDDCAMVSRQITGVLDVEDPIKGEYVLEVSSPGVDRPLFSLEQYQQHIGWMIKVKLHTAYEGRKRFQGVLTGIQDDELVLHVDTYEYLLPYEQIEQGQVIADISDLLKQAKRDKKKR